MDRTQQYEQFVIQALQEFQDYMAGSGDQNLKLVIDRESKNYQLMRIGWDEKRKREYGTIIHFSIKNDKIWLEYNGTQFNPFEDLERLGVPKSDLVIGFHSESRRGLSGYAVG
jgi:XisI protein